MRIPAIESIKEMGKKEYWNKANIVEFIAFTTKLVIIFPGLLFGVQFWWLYIFALASSILLVWSSTVKTLPTVILFNFGWIILATVAITKYFLS